jgi:hypothetical protein
MDLITAARQDLAARTTAELKALLATDHTGLVAAELRRRALAEVIAQPNS